MQRLGASCYLPRVSDMVWAELVQSGSSCPGCHRTLASVAVPAMSGDTEGGVPAACDYQDGSFSRGLRGLGHSWLQSHLSL